MRAGVIHLPMLLASLLHRLAGSTEDAVAIPRAMFMDVIDVVAEASNAQLRVERCGGDEGVS